MSSQNKAKRLTHFWHIAFLSEMVSIVDGSITLAQVYRLISECCYCILFKICF